MEMQDRTEAQLIQYIDAQNSLISKSDSASASGGKANPDLSEFEEKFSFLSSPSSIGLVVTEADGTIISFNKAVQSLLGFSIEECRNKNVSDFYADPHERQHLLEMLTKSKTIRNFEIHIKHKDGSLRTVLTTTDYIELDNSNVLLTSLYDITQYQQRQRTLKESEKSFRTLFKNAPVGITVTDFQGNLVISNNALQELTGYSAEEIKHLHAGDFYYIKSERQQLLDLTEGLGIVRDFETMFKHKNGSPISVLLNTDKIDFKNQSGMLLTSVRDISNLKQIEEDLTKERDFSNAILDITASLIFVLDREGRFTRFNKACEKTTGYSFDEMRGTYFGDAFYIDPEISKDTADLLLSGNHPKSHEAVWLSKSGDAHLISWTNTTLLGSNGTVEYVIATGIDITERRQAESKLQEANQELASWVKDLQARTEEMNLLNEMGEQLQSCQTIAEACAISAQYIKRICPASHGALYLINSSKNFAEAAEMWGEPSYTQNVFTPLNCWAIRRGRVHLVDDSHTGLLCEHITGPRSGQYLCIPMMVNGEAIGILHLNHVGTLSPAEQDTMGVTYTEHKSQLVVTISEHIALALSNLKLKETLRQQSIRDALTGLFNRRYMEETLERELMRAERENKSVGVIMFDIDHFKNFNDLAGHDAGDALLRELGIFLNKTTRGGDIVCRYGGEEFLAVLPGINMENAYLKAEELRKGTKELMVYHLGKPLAKCTISLGVAVFPENGSTSETLLKSADNALYRAKNEGRDRVILAQ